MRLLPARNANDEHADRPDVGRRQARLPELLQGAGVKRGNMLASLAALSVTVPTIFRGVIPSATSEAVSIGGETEPEAYQFGRQAFTDFSEIKAGHPTMNTLLRAAEDGWEYCWTYTYRNGIRFVDGMRINHQ